MVWRRVVNSSNVIINKSGHLVRSSLSKLSWSEFTDIIIVQIAQEAPHELGKRNHERTHNLHPTHSSIPQYLPVSSPGDIVRMDGDTCGDTRSHPVTPKTLKLQTHLYRGFVTAIRFFKPDQLILAPR